MRSHQGSPSTPARLSALRGGPPDRPPARLYYLDWLRVIATVGVFLFHVTNIFNNAGFEIKNSEQSELITIIQGLFFPWGMPLFFAVAGAGSWFALRRRTPGQFTRERTMRLLVPFLIGTFVLGPIQIYFSWRHRVETGVTGWTLSQFVADRLVHIGPKLFGALGYHMWFLGYLFAFSLLALPLLAWLKGEAGRAVVSRLAALCEHRGAILIFALPLVVVRLVLQPLFPLEHDWADFAVFGLFFLLGYLMYADERFTRAIRRDGWMLLIALIAFTLAFGLTLMSLESYGLEDAPATFSEFFFWACVSAAGWCGTAFMLFIGMRFLDRNNKALQYCLEVMLPFFVLHQTVILAIAYYVVQWEMGLLPKLLVVMLGSFAITLALCEFVIKRVGLLRLVFGMKASQRARTS